MCLIDYCFNSDFVEYVIISQDILIFGIQLTSFFMFLIEFIGWH